MSQENKGINWLMLVLFMRDICPDEDIINLIGLFLELGADPNLKNNISFMIGFRTVSSVSHYTLCYIHL